MCAWKLLRNNLLQINTTGIMLFHFHSLFNFIFSFQNLIFFCSPVSGKSPISSVLFCVFFIFLNEYKCSYWLSLLSEGPSLSPFISLLVMLILWCKFVLKNPVPQKLYAQSLLRAENYVSCLKYLCHHQNWKSL